MDTLCSMDNYSLIEKFLCGQSAKEEVEKLARILDDSGEHVFDEYCRRKWAENDCNIPNAARERIRRSITPLYGRSRRRSWIYRSIAAVFASAVVVLGLMLWMQPVPDVEPEIFEIVAERGQKSSVTLPDGSRVWINSASTISYTSNYNIKERRVRLSGEAYFEVASNADLPFVVQTTDVSVTALGTVFNVKAYEDDSYVLTTLIEGRVETVAGGQSKILAGAQEAIYDRQTEVLCAHSYKDAEHAVPWIRNELLFENEPLADIAVTLERMYNVTIVFENDTVKDYSYTGLIRNNSLQNVLELISGTSPVGYVMNTNTIKFFMKH